MNDNHQLLAPSFVFRFAVPCRYYEGGPGTPIELPESHRIPSFGELDGRQLFGDLRMGWNPQTLSVWLEVSGKQQSLWCREGRVEESDGLALLIDTRPTGDIHRASRFCHQFRLLPQGGGRQGDQPVATLMPIARARENPKPVRSDAITVQAQMRPSGYRLWATIATAALTGFDPEESRSIGFAYAILDRELGWQTFSAGSEFPILSDPSLWGKLELVGQPSTP